MYPDTKRIRDNRVMLRLDDYEHQLVVALANYQGEPLATLMRKMIMREAAELVGCDGASVARHSA
jgi:hypothetical protein